MFVFNFHRCGTFVFTFLFLVATLEEVAEAQNQRPIGGDVYSTLRIVNRLCYHPGDHSERIARPFFGCYDYAPGKNLFVYCQRRIYGNALDSKAHIDVACQSSRRLPSYAMCLQNAFQRTGIDMNNAVTRINICQARVLGI